MKIEATATLDFEAIRTLVHLSVYKKKKPKNRMILSAILFSLLLLVILFEMFYFGYNPTLLILLALTLTMLGLRLFLFFGLPKKQFDAMGKMQNAVNHYIFDDDSITVKTVTVEYSGEAVMDYSALVKVYETQKYIFFHQVNNSAYVVDKSTVSGGSVDELKSKLISAVGDKYYICKY